MVTIRHLLALAAVGLLVTGPGSAAAAATGVRIVGARPAEARELARIVRTLGPTHVRRIELFAHRNAGRVRLVLSVDTAKTVRDEWDAQLLAHLYRLRTTQLHLRPVAALWIGDDRHARPAPEHPFARPDLAAVRGVLDHSSVQVLELRDLAGAVVLRVRTDSPGTFLRDDAGSALDAVGSIVTRAAYLAVENGHGELVYATGQVQGRIRQTGKRDFLGCGVVPLSGGPATVPGTVRRTPLRCRT
jgi:hypothetical protein